MTSFLQKGMQSMSAVMLCNYLRIQFYSKFDIVLLRSFAEIGWSKEQYHKCSWLQIYKTKWPYKLLVQQVPLRITCLCCLYRYLCQPQKSGCQENSMGFVSPIWRRGMHADEILSFNLYSHILRPFLKIFNIRTFVCLRLLADIASIRLR